MSRADAIFWIKNNPQLLPSLFTKLPASAASKPCGCPINRTGCLETTEPDSWVPSWIHNDDGTNDPDCQMCEAHNIVDNIINMCNEVNPKGQVTSSDIHCMQAGYIEPMTLLTPQRSPRYNEYMEPLGLWVKPFRMLWEFETNEIIFNHAPMPWVIARLEHIAQQSNIAMTDDQSLDECAIVNHLGNDFNRFPPRTQKFLDDMYGMWQELR
jgi:hypothetical protein